MKLTAKLVIVFMLVSIALTAINGYLAVQHEARIFENDMKEYAARVGTTMEKMVVIVWRDQGQQGVLTLIKSENRQQSRIKIRWVWLDARPRDPDGPRVPADQLRGVSQVPASIKVRDQQGNRYIHTYVPIDLDTKRKGGLELTGSLAELDKYTRTTLYRTFVVMGVMVLACGVLIAVLGVRVVGKPLEQLIEKTRRAGAGDLSGPLHLEGNDELSELAGSLNHMCHQLAESQQKLQEQSTARIAALDQLRHADRLRTVGRLASGIAHELGTPLNVVSGRAGLIASGKLPDEEIIQSALTIKTQTDQMASIIRQLLDFSRHRTPQRAAVNLRQVADQTVELLTTISQKRGTTITVDGPDKPQTALVDLGRIQQVLSNIIVNAIQSMSDGGPIRIGLRQARVCAPEAIDGKTTEFIAIDIRDQGHGIRGEDLEHVFEPFFTTKEVGEGTGLGLSIAYGIVQEHGGWIEVKSELGQGSCFSVYLPKEADECATES